MGLKPGMTNNPNGRLKGIPNRTTSEVRKVIINILHDNVEQINEDLKALTPKDRIAALVALAQLALPRLSAVAVGSADGEGLEKKQIFLIGGQEIEF